MHKAAKLEGRIVRNLHTRNVGTARGGSQLRKRLRRTDNACTGGGGNSDVIVGDTHPVSLVGKSLQNIVEGAEGRIVCHTDADGSRGFYRCPEQRFQQRTFCGVRKPHSAAHPEAGSVLFKHLGLRQQAIHRIRSRAGQDIGSQKDKQDRKKTPEHSHTITGIFTTDPQVRWDCHKPPWDRVPCNPYKVPSCQNPGRS